MNSECIAVLTAVGVCVLSISPAHAEMKSMGQYEYENSCSSCHGMSDTGGGPSAQFLSNGSAPDLTVLKENNGGVFSADRVCEIIDGTGPARRLIHGTTEMPIWGDRYLQRTDDYQGGDPYSPEERVEYVTKRIKALVEYLSSIQRD